MYDYMTTQLRKLAAACLQQKLFNTAVRAVYGMSATTIFRVPSMLWVQAWWAGPL